MGGSQALTSFHDRDDRRCRGWLRMRVAHTDTHALAVAQRGTVAGAEWTPRCGGLAGYSASSAIGGPLGRAERAHARTDDGADTWGDQTADSRAHAYVDPQIDHAALPQRNIRTDQAPTPEPPPGPNPDARADASAHSRADASAYSRADPRADPGPDSRTDPGPRPPSRPRTRARTDPRPDPRTDPGPDPGADPGPTPDPTPEPTPEPTPDPTPEPTPDPSESPWLIAAIAGPDVPIAGRQPQAPQDRLPGIDISRSQGAIDLSVARDAGIRFVYTKATQGTSIVRDPGCGAHDFGTRGRIRRRVVPLLRLPQRRGHTGQPLRQRDGRQRRPG